MAMDSIPVGDVVTGPTGGPRTPDNFAVRCPPGGAYCFYFRGGPELTGGPMVTTADLTLWGLGIPGVSVRVNGRLGLDLDGDETWPGTEPAVQMIEAYAEYAHRQFTVRGGRQLLVHRLGVTGFDGGRGIVRVGRSGVEVDGYAGLGLARATALTPTSPALDPLDEFQPQSRQILAGAALGYQGRLWNAQAGLPAGGRSRQPQLRLGARGAIARRSARPGTGASPRGWTTIWPTPGSATPTRWCATRRPGSR